ERLSPEPSQVARLLIPEGEPLPPAHRLVVLIPDQDMNDAELARRVWGLASPRGLAILFLGLCDGLEESRVRRRLATLAAITRDDWVRAEIRLEFEGDWRRSIKAIWRPGDLVVCHAEQTVEAWGVGRKPLSQALVSALNAPVYVFSGFYSELPTPPFSLASRLFSWAIPLAILAGFFWIQVQIDRLPTDWARTTLFILSVLAEFGLVWIWHRLSF
ncbi:MAG: hypothetical protein ACRDH2_07865, partial [Anaerolineales bacterium]